VLVVEDEIDAAEILDSLLRHYNLLVDHVNCAENAYETLLLQDYDAVIVDLGLPGMDGLELMRHIRQDARLAALPCIAITAYNSSGMKKQAYDAGYDRYYAKPINADDLMRGLSEIIR
jgi:two-component system OmpR family response regulator